MSQSLRDNTHTFETFSVSGTVYVTIDEQLIACHKFDHHIKITVLFDKAAPCTSDKDGPYRSTETSSQLSALCKEEMPCLLSAHSPAGDTYQLQTEAFETPSNLTLSDGFVTSAQPCQPSQFANHELKCADDLVPVIETQKLVYDDTEEDDTVETVCDKNQSCERPDGVLDSGSCEEISGSKRGRKRKRSYKLHSDKGVKTCRHRRKSTKIKNKNTRTHGAKQNLKSQKNDQTLKITFRSTKKSSNEDAQMESSCTENNKTDQRERTKTQKTYIRKLDQEKEVKCIYCQETFRSQQEFFNHRKGDRTSYKCKYCGKVIPFKAHLIVHLRKHNERMTSDYLLNNTDSEENSTKLLVTTDSVVEEEQSEQGKGVKCDICGLKVSNIPILKSHTMIHTGEYAYQCCVCGEKTRSISKHSNHLAIHLKAGRVQCKICNINFESRSALSKHQLTHEFKCNICDKVFPNKTSRVFHYKMAHKDEILRCHICGKMFSSNEELAPHLKYHRNRAKTQCTVCGLFVTRLDNHMLSHTQESEEDKMFVCDKCPKKFRQKLSYQRHARTHSEEKPYACMECPKTFSRSGGLRRHMITHTQERPFVCEICGKACSQMGNLRIHMQIHKDSVPVQCQVCGESFAYKNALQEHMRESHYVDMNAESSKYVPPVPHVYYY